MLVSTDDEEIAAVARRYGAEVPFLRPAELARDDTPDLPVFEHALALARAGARVDRPELVVQLRPTSPFRPVGMVDEAVSLLRAHPGADSLRAVTAPAQTPYKMWRLGGPILEPLLGRSRRSCSTPRASGCRPCSGRRATSTWCAGRRSWSERSMTGRRIVPLVVEPRYAVDIDTLDQLELAEWLLARDAVVLVRPDAERQCA